MAEAFYNATEGSGKKFHAWDRVIGANTVLAEFVLMGEYPLPTYTVHAAGVSCATVNDHILQIMAGASLVVRLRRVLIFQAGLAGAVNTGAFQLVRLTTAGTGGTAVTPGRVDNSDAAAGCTAMTLPTVKGTESTIIRQGRIGVYAAQPSNPNAKPLEMWQENLSGRAKPFLIAAGTANGVAVKSMAAVAGLTVDVFAEVVETSYV